MRRTKADAEMTRKTILEAAYSLFLLHGYNAVSLADIVEKTEFTRGAVYWHFKDKRDLYEECIREKLLEIQREIKDGFEEADTLERFLKTSLIRVASDQKYHFVNQSIILKQVVPELEPIAEEVATVKQGYYQLLKTLIEKQHPGCVIEKDELNMHINKVFLVFEGTHQLVLQGILKPVLSRQELDSIVEMLTHHHEGQDHTVTL